MSITSRVVKDVAASVCITAPVASVMAPPDETVSALASIAPSSVEFTSVIETSAVVAPVNVVSTETAPKELPPCVNVTAPPLVLNVARSAAVIAMVCEMVPDEVAVSSSTPVSAPPKTMAPPPSATSPFPPISVSAPFAFAVIIPSVRSDVPVSCISSPDRVTAPPNTLEALSKRMSRSAVMDVVPVTSIVSPAMSVTPPNVDWTIRLPDAVIDPSATPPSMFRLTFSALSVTPAPGEISPPEIRVRSPERVILLSRKRPAPLALRVRLPAPVGSIGLPACRLIELLACRRTLPPLSCVSIAPAEMLNVVPYPPSAKRIWSSAS